MAQLQWASIGYYLNTKSLGNWMISYKYTETEEKNSNRFYNPTSQLDYGKVNYYDHVATASWYRKFQHKLASFSWLSHINKAKDFNYYLDGANYTSFTVNQEAAAGISFGKKMASRCMSLWLLSNPTNGNKKMAIIYLEAIMPKTPMI